MGNDSAFLAEIITTFLDDSPGQLAAIRSGLEGRDSATVRRAAHTLKSNAATFGLVELTPLCRELENRASGGDLTGAAELVVSIDRALADGRAALQVLAAEAAG